MAGPEKVGVVRVSLLAWRDAQQHLGNVGWNRAVNGVAGLFLVNHDGPHSCGWILRESILFERYRLADSQPGPTHHFGKRANPITANSEGIVLIDGWPITVGVRRIIASTVAAIFRLKVSGLPCLDLGDSFQGRA